MEGGEVGCPSREQEGTPSRATCESAGNVAIYRKQIADCKKWESTADITNNVENNISIK